MNTKFSFLTAALFSAVLFSDQPVKINLSVPSLFMDNMVLQRNMKTPIWGMSEVNSTVSVKINKAVVETGSDSNGKWKAILPELEACEPFTILIESDDAKIELK
ncbi:MAG: hypothetical protein KJ799_08695 [Bacteroidetes bacterium]|nr:hypothetical protein [Bacteroidota bacterium]